MIMNIIIINHRHYYEAHDDDDDVMASRTCPRLQGWVAHGRDYRDRRHLGFYGSRYCRGKSRIGAIVTTVIAR